MKLLLLGSNGQLGWELQRSLSPLGKIFACNRNTVDFNDLDKLKSVVRKYRPDVIVNAAAYTNVDKAESDAENAFRVNFEAVNLLANEAAVLNSWLIHYSTDYIFDGIKNGSYKEEDKTNPKSVYGKSKLQGELAIIDSKCKYLIFRTSWLYSTYGRNFVNTVLRIAKERSELRVVCDQIGTPTSAELVADVSSLCLSQIVQDDLSSKDISGVYHLTPTGKTSWYNFAKYVIIETKKLGGVFLTDPENIIAINTSEYPLPAERPANSILNSQKLCKTFNLYLPSWKIHADRAIKELYLREL